MVELYANRGDTDQMPHIVASDLGLHCLPITLLGISRLQWVKSNFLEQSFEAFFLPIKILDVIMKHAYSNT